VIHSDLIGLTGTLPHIDTQAHLPAHRYACSQCLDVMAQANKSAKQQALKNAKYLRLLQIVLLAANVRGQPPPWTGACMDVLTGTFCCRTGQVVFLAFLLFFAGELSTWAVVRVVFVYGLQVGSYGLLHKSIQPKYGPSGEVLDGGHDLSIGGVMEYVQDVFFVASAVMIGAPFFDGAWYILLVVRFDRRCRHATLIRPRCLRAQIPGFLVYLLVGYVFKQLKESLVSGDSSGEGEHANRRARRTARD
jgi:hypothetical protein